MTLPNKFGDLTNKLDKKLNFKSILLVNTHYLNHLFSGDRTLKISFIPDKYDEFENYILKLNNKFDLICVDPYHEYKQSIDTFNVLLPLLNENGILISHDCYPPNFMSSYPTYKGGEWCGATYAAFIEIAYQHPEWYYAIINKDYGLGIISKKQIEYVKKITNNTSQKIFLDMFKSNQYEDAYQYFRAYSSDIINVVEKTKIAIYSCNFGNYRGEFQHYYNVIFDDKIDYFLFTDRNLSKIELEKLNKWNICKMSILSSDDAMNGSRWTCKYIKFTVPTQLSAYDIIIWIDNKRFLKGDKMNTITYNQIVNILDRYPNHDIFNVKHTSRTTIQQELAETIRLRFENVEFAKKFAVVVKNFVSTFDLPDNCVIIRKNTHLVNDAFAYCFQLMKDYKLKRDQNVYNYALDNKKITPILLNYKDLTFIR